ncbi:hypothetical protein PINS_up018625 [Pythium insidiosum]|nr:hypothetical protein PINS_up018625 [Pythium insidiosum]
MSLANGSFIDELAQLLASLRRPLTRPADLLDPVAVEMQQVVAELPDAVAMKTSHRGFVAMVMRTLKCLLERHTTIRDMTPGVTTPSFWMCIGVVHRLFAEIEFFMRLLAVDTAPIPLRHHASELHNLVLALSDLTGCST